MARALKTEKQKTTDEVITNVTEDNIIAKKSSKKAVKKSTEKSTDISKIKAITKKSKTAKTIKKAVETNKELVDLYDKEVEIDKKLIELDKEVIIENKSGLEHKIGHKIEDHKVYHEINNNVENKKEDFKLEIKQDAKKEAKQEAKQDLNQEVKRTFTSRSAIAADACIDINEGMMMKAMPTKCLPELIGASVVASEPTPKDAKKTIAKKDGMQQALEILDEYYKDTPPRDPRFPQHEE